MHNVMLLITLDFITNQDKLTSEADDDTRIRRQYIPIKRTDSGETS